MPATQAVTAIGVDLGIARFATFSDGTCVAPATVLKPKPLSSPNTSGAWPKQKIQQQLEKAKAKVQKIHTQIANTRRDFLHKATDTISKNHAVVFVEDLQVGNMSKSAAGTAEKSR